MKKIFLIIALILAISSCGLQEEKPIDGNSGSIEKTVINEEIYDISNVNIGEDIYGLKLKDKKISENKDVVFSLVGEKEFSGKLSGFYDEMSEKNVFYFKSDKEKTLIIPFPTNKDKEILFSTKIANTGILDENLKEKLLSGKEIKAKLTITKYDYLGYNLSEKFVSMEVKNLQVLDKLEEKSEKKDDFKDIALEAFGNEPAWSIKIVGNNLKYSSPLLFSDENKEGSENYKLDSVKKEGENMIFEGKKVKATFTKKACKTDGLGNTIDYSVEFLFEGDMLYKGCGEEVLDDFFVKGKKGAYNEIAKKVGWELENNEGTSVPDSEYEIFSVHGPYFYAGIGVPSGGGYFGVYKKVGSKYETVCEGQDITLEHCENVAKNHDGLLDYPGFPFEGCRELLENKKADSKENNSCMEAKINLIKNSPDLKDYINLLDDAKAKKAGSLYDYKIKLTASGGGFENFVITEIHREEDGTERETNTKYFQIKENEAKVQEYDVIGNKYKDLNLSKESVEDYDKHCK